MNLFVIQAIILVLILFTVLEGRRGKLKRIKYGSYLVYYGMFTKFLWFVVGVIIPAILVWLLLVEYSGKGYSASFLPYVLLLLLFFFGGGYQLLTTIYEVILLTPSYFVHKTIFSKKEIFYESIKMVSYNSRMMQINITLQDNTNVKFSPQMKGYLVFIEILKAKLPKECFDDSVNKLVIYGA